MDILEEKNQNHDHPGFFNVFIDCHARYLVVDLSRGLYKRWTAKDRSCAGTRPDWNFEVTTSWLSQKQWQLTFQYRIFKSLFIHFFRTIFSYFVTMHIGKSYKLSEFLVWTRRDIYRLVVIGVGAVVLYQIVGLTWVAIPWTVVALLGTATAFIVGFKNTQTYNRTWEARQIWGEIVNNSRSWGIVSRDFLSNPTKSKLLIYRHLAWLTVMRFQMREKRAWENVRKRYNVEYQKYYRIPENDTSLEAELSKYLSPEELTYILSTKSKATQIMALQSKTLKELYTTQEIVVLQLVEMQRTIKEFYTQQGRSERIKNFPYPRQFATINAMFVKLFSFLLPFGMLREFDKLNENVAGLMKGNMIWWVIPFSVLISWVYTSLEQVGESTENPFEGTANDVPISQLCRMIEIDLREMLGETDLPPPLEPKHDIIL